MSNVEWYGADVIRSANSAKKGALTMAAIVVNMDATMLAPVDTGNLRDSVTYEVDEDEARVGTNVDYAPHLEYGTVKMAAQPYLRPSLDNNKSQIEKMIGDVIGKAAEAGGRK